MSVEDELTELSTVYHGLIDENVELEERHERLQERSQQLEQLLRDTFAYIKEVMPTTFREGEGMRHLRERKKALVGDENKHSDE